MRPLRRRAVSVLMLIGGCSWSGYGTSGTSIVVRNTCDLPVVVRLTSQNWERSTVDQLRGTTLAPGGSVDATAINPPDKREGLVLRISSERGDPIVPVPAERNLDLEVSLDPTICAALDPEAARCVPSIDKNNLVVCQ